MIRVFLSALVAASVASAETLVEMPHMGKLLDNGDQAVDNPALAMKFAIYDAEVPISTERKLWSASYTVLVSKGFYAVVLGSGAGNALPVSVLSADGSRFLQASVNDVALLPRMKLTAVPRANWADTLQGQPLSAIEQKSELALSHYTRTEIDALLAPLATSRTLSDTEAALRTDLLSKTDAAATYLTQADGKTTYLAQADATTTYLAKSAATTTYLAQAAATTTYLAKSDAYAGYLSKNASGDSTIARNATIGGNASVAGTLSVAGTTTHGGNIVGINDTLSFKVDPNGGSGDTAALSFKAYTPAAAEGSELLIDVGNDANDRIRLHATGGVVVDPSGNAGPSFTTPCQTGYTAINGGRICVGAMGAATDFYTAETGCRTSPGAGLSAHVCTYADLQSACGNGFDAYAGKGGGWYGDLGQADDFFQTWNSGNCNGTNNTGTPTAANASLPYRCCY